MTWPNVTVNQLNQRQGIIPEIERNMLFIGFSADEKTDFIILDSQTDIHSLQGKMSAALLSNLRAAQLNAGQNWQAAVATIAKAPITPGAAIPAFADLIMGVQQQLSVEGIVLVTDRSLTDSAGIKKDIDMLSSCRADLIAKFGRWVFFILAVPGISSALTWGEYLATLATISTGVAAYAVMLAPMIFGNEPGIVAGRLCDRSVTVADSPARVKTGAINLGESVDIYHDGTAQYDGSVNLGGDVPLDSDTQPLTLGTLRALHDLRYSVPMWYADYEGIYWSDGLTLDVKGGDFQVIENVRIVDKVARRIRIQAIPKIADRTMNSTPGSITAHQTYFARTLRDMSRSTQINGMTFPGEVTPRDGDVVIQWTDPVSVSIYVTVRPYNSAKSITVGIMLDSTLEG